MKNKYIVLKAFDRSTPERPCWMARVMDAEGNIALECHGDTKSEAESCAIVCSTALEMDDEIKESEAV